eukprot:7387641-Prymnesium_polylepis.1
MALKDKAYETVASSTTVSERDDRHSESLAMLNSKALDCYRRGGHLLSLFGRLGGASATGTARGDGEPLHARCGRHELLSGRHDRSPQEWVACERGYRGR